MDIFCRASEGPRIGQSAEHCSERSDAHFSSTKKKLQPPCNGAQGVKRCQWLLPSDFGLGTRYVTEKRSVGRYKCPVYTGGYIGQKLVNVIGPHLPNYLRQRLRSEPILKSKTRWIYSIESGAKGCISQYSILSVKEVSTAVWCTGRYIIIICWVLCSWSSCEWTTRSSKGRGPPLFKRWLIMLYHCSEHDSLTLTGSVTCSTFRPTIDYWDWGSSVKK